MAKLEVHRKTDRPGWTVKDHPASAHGRKNGHEPYKPSDGRMHKKDCEHTQIVDDIGTLSQGRCLDCGHHIRFGVWVINEHIPPFTDDELVEWRRKFNKFWFEPKHTLEELGKSIHEL